VLTYNNLSCIYRKIGDYDKAVKVLNLTISIEEKLALSNPISAISIISTYLNKSAILSENKQHKEALDAAKLAEINLNKIIKKYGPNTPEGAHLKYLELLTDYNMASEMEHLQQKDQATKKYELALELAKQLKRNDFIDQLEKILKK
jgi:tetratricopeptide (TPR) repeat protein